jgi:hypothetical protein
VKSLTRTKANLLVLVGSRDEVPRTVTVARRRLAQPIVVA